VLLLIYSVDAMRVNTQKGGKTKILQGFRLLPTFIVFLL